MSLNKLLVGKTVVVVSHAGPMVKGRMGKIVGLYRGLDVEVAFSDMYFWPARARVNIRGLRAPEQVGAHKRVMTTAAAHPSHKLYTHKDFTKAEARRNNPIALAVIVGGARICKQCGAGGISGLYHQCKAAKKRHAA